MAKVIWEIVEGTFTNNNLTFPRLRLATWEAQNGYPGFLGRQHRAFDMSQ